MKKRLKDLLESQINSLLTRIDEELPSLHSDDDGFGRRFHNNNNGNINVVSNNNGDLTDIREEI